VIPDESVYEASYHDGVHNRAGAYVNFNANQAWISEHKNQKLYFSR
jgi:hypothetical protein